MSRSSRESRAEFDEGYTEQADPAGMYAYAPALLSIQEVVEAVNDAVLENGLFEPNRIMLFAAEIEK